MKRMFVLALFLSAAASWFMTQGKPTPSTQADCPAGAIAPGGPRVTPDKRVALKLPLASPHIVVRKSDRRLTLFDGDREIRVYRIGLGFAPLGDKSRQGDGRTPEGTFYVCVKNTASRFYLSLGLSYPDKDHARRALRDGLITRSQFDEIAGAIDRQQRPPWDTALGGEIFIHGNGSSSDWTWGCVALEDSDIKELFDAVPKGTPVLIEP